MILDGIQSKIPTIFRTSMKSAARGKEEEKRRKRKGGREEEEEERRKRRGGREEEDQKRRGGTCGEKGVRTRRCEGDGVRREV